MLAPGPTPHDPFDLGHLDFGVRCVHCSWRVVGMDVVHLDASGTVPRMTAKSRDGSRTAIVVRDPPREAVAGVAGTVSKGWATPALCLSCGALLGMRGLIRPPTLLLWRRSARNHVCPSCGASGVLPFAASPLEPLDALVLALAFAIAGGLLPLRFLPVMPIALKLGIVIVLGVGCGIGGYVLGLLRWGRGLNAVRDWFANNRCPQCSAVGLAHRRGLGHFGCMGGEDPFGDWPIERIGAESGPDWKASHFGLHRFLYEERVAGRWKRIEIDGEMLTGTPHHVIYFDSLAKWQSYPEWARDRRNEIIARVKEALPLPDYDYEGEFEPQGVETIQRVKVAITRSAGCKIVVEPWANEFDAKQGEVWEVELTGPACGCSPELNIENEQERVTVWGWTGCTMKVFRDGTLVDHSPNRVPEIPGHSHPAA